MHSTRQVPRTISALALTSVLSLGLSGCFSSGGSDVDSEGRIHVAMLQPPRSGLTPLSDDAFKLSRWSTAETLINLNDDAEPQPGLSDEWEQVDDKTWRFHVREGVTFHDGTELTAEAVANALQHAVDADPIPRILDGVDMTVKADGDSVQIMTADTDPLLPNRLSSPQLSILAESAYEGDKVSPVGTGTGAYELKKIDGTSSATLDRYDGYWGETAAAAGIDVDFVPDGTARTAALRTGEADIVEAVPAGQASNVDESLITEVPMPRTNTLYLNSEKGPFKDPAVRAAARDAIQRADIISNAYEGKADEASGLLGPALPWAADLRGSEEYAKILEQRAEPAEVDGVEITLGTFTDRAELPEVAVILQQQLERAGFTVKQDVREYQYIESDAIDGKFDAFILSRATVLDSGDPVAYFAADFTCEGGFNISQLCDDTVDEAVREASRVAPGEERRNKTMLAEAQILATDTAIPMLHERVVQGESERVKNAAQDPRERLLVTGATALEKVE